MDKKTRTRVPEGTTRVRNAVTGEVKNCGYDQFAHGMTKREAFANEQMSGLIQEYAGAARPDEIAKMAVDYADALLAALEAPVPDKARDLVLNFDRIYNTGLTTRQINALTSAIINFSGEE